MIMRVRLKLTRGGQISVPAAVRKRWATSALIAEDQGDRLILTPAPDDPIDALAGIFAPEGETARARGVTTESGRQEDREAEAEGEDRRFGP